MSDRAPFVPPPSSVITAPALQRRGSRPPLCLPPGNCCQETAAPSLWWPRLRLSTLPLIPLPTSQVHRPSTHIPTKTLLKRYSLD
jgi:hypothetical protein